MKNSSPHLLQAGMTAVLLCFLVLFGMQAFGGGINSRADFDAVSTKVTESLDPSVYEPVSVSGIRRYLDLNPESFTDVAFYRNGDAMSANELAIVRFDSEKAARDFEKAVNERIHSQHEIYAGYAPEQAALMEQALVDIQGNYALYYTGDNPSQIDSLFVSALKGGN
ncbi:DUF4358 domain-containing protein [Allobaculum mucilyticum]|uniref:DUF4358 domain-containing protein n=1 Tax=Allobaculum mucilyticum TaxID=2834459 RepID=UPI001E3117B8|nr:DUF4358 domain-containing protein [Allobaculum mucilyticum]UNT96894.1 DUF4358 domain-containing protein [Allobaculum mucilyticum]